jgi:hypothetical protein
VKKILILSSLILVHFGCVNTLYAQSLPATINVSWDAPPLNENVSSYDVTLDGVVKAVPATVVAGRVATTVIVNAYGHHDMTIVAKSVSLACDDPTQCNTISIASSVPLPAGFTLSAAPSKPGNGKVVKP